PKIHRIAMPWPGGRPPRGARAPDSRPGGAGPRRSGQSGQATPKMCLCRPPGACHPCRCLGRTALQAALSDLALCRGRTIPTSASSSNSSLCWMTSCVRCTWKSRFCRSSCGRSRLSCGPRSRRSRKPPRGRRRHEPLDTGIWSRHKPAPCRCTSAR
ncbi:unnamed protein product, partial [Effrenium voratum]